MKQIMIKEHYIIGLGCDTEQLQESNDYSTLSKAIGIHILNFVSIPNAKKYHNVFHIREKETGLTYFEDLEFAHCRIEKVCF